MTSLKSDKYDNSDIYGEGYGSSHTWKRGENRNLGSVQAALRGSCYTCSTCKVTFRHYYDLTPNIFKAIQECGVDDKCSENPELILPKQIRLRQLQRDLAIALSPVKKDDYDCLERVRPRLIREILREIEVLSQDEKIFVSAREPKEGLSMKDYGETVSYF